MAIKITVSLLENAYPGEVVPKPKYSLNLIHNLNANSEAITSAEYRFSWVPP